MKLLNDMTIEEELIFEQEIAEYFRNEQAKPQRPVIYLPTAQYGESLIGPINE